MPLPSNAIFTAEIHVLGTSAAGGSNNRLTNATFFYKRGSGGPALTKAALDAIFQANVVATLAAALNVRWLQSANTIRWVEDAQDSPVSISHALAGAVAGDGMPMHNAFMFLFKTGLRGKSFRGAKHFFPLSEADTTLGSEDILNAAAIARAQTLAAALLASQTDSNGNVWVPQVFSRKLSQTRNNPTTLVSNAVTQVLFNKRIGRMRRREVRSAY